MTHSPAFRDAAESVRDQQDKRGINRSHSAPKATRVPQLVPEHPCVRLLRRGRRFSALRRSAAEISWAGPEKKDS